MTLEFSGEVWFWKGPAPFYFLWVPEAESREIKAIESLVTYGWGMIPVSARIGKTEWATALWPKDGRYVLPLKNEGPPSREHRRRRPHRRPDRDRPMTPREEIDAEIARYPDWRGAMLAHLRALIHEADPSLVEAWKWNTPVFANRKDVVAIGVFKEHVKANFFQGAALADPAKLFNAGLDAKKSRSIDLREGAALDEAAFRELVRAAAKLSA